MSDLRKASQKSKINLFILIKIFRWNKSPSDNFSAIETVQSLLFLVSQFSSTSLLELLSSKGPHLEGFRIRFILHLKYTIQVFNQMNFIRKHYCVPTRKGFKIFFSFKTFSSTEELKVKQALWVSARVYAMIFLRWQIKVRFTLQIFNMKFLNFANQLVKAKLST